MFSMVERRSRSIRRFGKRLINLPERSPGLGDLPGSMEALPRFVQIEESVVAGDLESALRNHPITKSLIEEAKATGKDVVGFLQRDGKWVAMGVGLAAGIAGAVYLYTHDESLRQKIEEEKRVYLEKLKMRLTKYSK